MTSLNSASPLYKSAAWSLMGTVVPMIAAIVAVPLLLKYLGQERLGVLSLILVVVGYFSFLDMGLGRAVTVAVATVSHQPESASATLDQLAIVGTASLLLVILGCVIAGLAGLAIGLWGVPVRMSSVTFQDEVQFALLWMLPSLPLLLLSSTLRGHLEGVGAFRLLNIIRIPTGVMLAAGPCLTALFSPELAWACISILIVRLVHVATLFWLVSRQIGLRTASLARQLVENSSVTWLRQLMSFGGWATVSNVVGPVIVYLDRFVIGFALAAGTIAIYAVPFDAVSRLPVLIASLCSVLLPEFARLSHLALAQTSQRKALFNLVKTSAALSACVIVPVVLLGCAVTPWALRIWLGPEFAEKSTLITQVLIVAFGFNSLAQIPFTALQAVGKVRDVAWVHLSQLLPYCVLVFVFISWFGVLGAAYAWLLRSMLDCAMLAWLWHRHSAAVG